MQKYTCLGHKAFVKEGRVYEILPQGNASECPSSPKDADGRMQVSLTRNDGKRVQRVRAHVCWEAYHQRKKPTGMVVDHVDSKRPWDDSKGNLRLKTQKENTELSFASGPRQKQAVVCTHRDGRQLHFDSYNACGKYFGVGGRNRVRDAVLRGDYAKRSHSPFVDWIIRKA